MSAALQTNLHRNVALESLGGVRVLRQMCRRRGAGGRKTFHFDFEGSKFNLRISEPAHPSVPRNHGVPFSKATLRPPQRVEAGDGVHGEASESEEEGRGARKGGRGAKIITMMKSESECNDDAAADVVELGSDRPYSVQKD